MSPGGRSREHPKEGVTPPSPQTLSAKLCLSAKKVCPSPPAKKCKTVSIGKMMKGQWRRYALDKMIKIEVEIYSALLQNVITFDC